ncbi:MAG: TetR/AcrR family transcriptional regulator [Rhizobiaceae bacterium]|nr:TetR/AcrR family transcriptional regulator [Rhizobiaceae bacterium]
MVTKPPKTRDAEATAKAIADAALALIAEKGFAALGVNAVAARAGVDKVLIYRYFDGLDGVLSALAGRRELWLGPTEPTDVAPGPYGPVMAAFLQRYLRALRANPLVLRVIAWELIENSERVKLLSEARAKAIRQWFAEVRKQAGQPATGVDAPAINALLIAGVHHLALREVSAGDFSGLDLTRAETWQRVEQSIEALMNAVHPET